MRLTQFSNFAVRVLMYAALHGDRPSSAPEMARAYGISYDHLKKAASELCRLGYLLPVRGRAGGFLLAQPPDAIRIGEVIRQTEGAVILVECFDPAANTCPLIAGCGFRTALREALDAFFGVLDRYTLADFVHRPEALTLWLGLGDAAAGAVPRPETPPA